MEESCVTVRTNDKSLASRSTTPSPPSDASPAVVATIAGKSGTAAGVAPLSAFRIISSCREEKISGEIFHVPFCGQGGGGRLSTVATAAANGRGQAAAEADPVGHVHDGVDGEDDHLLVLAVTIRRVAREDQHLEQWKRCVRGGGRGVQGSVLAR